MWLIAFSALVFAVAGQYLTTTMLDWGEWVERKFLAETFQNQVIFRIQTASCNESQNLPTKHKRKPVARNPQHGAAKIPRKKMTHGLKTRAHGNSLSATP